MSEHSSSAGPGSTRRDGAGDGQAAAAPAARRLVELDQAEALRLLGSVRLGRVVFTRDALPAIRPVNHIVDQGLVVFRTSKGTVLSAIGGMEAIGPVVAYEADSIDTDTRKGWSVAVVGRASAVTDPALIQRYQELCEPWVDSVMDRVVCIRPRLVSGFRLL